MPDRKAPMPGNVMRDVAELGNYDDLASCPEDVTDDVNKAQVTTSVVLRDDYGDPERRVHRPVLDIDFPAQLIPSSTPGHFHLYLDVEIPHAAYMTLLDALADVGIVEPGYAGVSKERGYTAVRLPWVKKEAAPDA